MALVYRTLETVDYNQRKLVFVSDRNHGILKGVKTVFPDCNHGYCYKHLTANLKDKFRGVPKLVRAKVVRQFADCVYASTKDEFNHCHAKLIATGGQRCSSFIADLFRRSGPMLTLKGKDTVR